MSRITRRDFNPLFQDDATANYLIRLNYLDFRLPILFGIANAQDKGLLKPVDNLHVVPKEVYPAGHAFNELITTPNLLGIIEAAKSKGGSRRLVLDRITNELPLSIAVYPIQNYMLAYIRYTIQKHVSMTGYMMDETSVLRQIPGMITFLNRMVADPNINAADAYNYNLNDRLLTKSSDRTTGAECYTIGIKDWQPFVMHSPPGTLRWDIPQ